MKKKCVLASQSPRRRELMTYLGLSFSVVPSNVEEILDGNLSIESQIESIAVQKARPILESNQDRVVIGADTVVVLDGEILGKPKTAEKAVEMLRKLSGRTHEVITGVALLSSENEVIFHNKTFVTFYELSDEEITRYVNTKDPLDKAGAYSIQGQGGLFVSKIDGDFYSVVGLPISRIYHELTHNNW
ncbi:septum formation protein Maf [Erysipelothrix larvae]|uniref:dTTP/UTP pyrophosphatase n=1 Tax=Erysipelothrix larvae TaxID=1514105 RepID=A0A0X8GYJ3_9FIRM|nr:Maf family protein [Erysipelothrix larvae]AMC92784.1 septum formation protein Maf [Erysipelothrix larvae]